LGIWARNKVGESQFAHIPKALSRIKHRGPDNQQYKVYSNLALGHTRLSIIDLNAISNQPFSDESGRYHIVFNGEIYNYKALRENLKKEGVIFKTESDTEVLLQLLIKKGEKAIAELNGFFAFLFYDSFDKELLAVRDRFGIKPLLYYKDDDKIIFSSELPAILSFDIDRSIDNQALNNYFSFTYIPSPLTIFSGIKKLQPGELLRLKDDKISLKKYYTIDKKIPFKKSYSEAKEKLDDLLTKSVERRLVADVPVGSFLSGGLDSSIISMLAKRQKDDLRTFSIGFDHAYFNESDYAEKMANHIGSKHETIIFSKSEFKKNLPDFLDSIDEPFADSSSYAVYLLSQKTKEQVTVSLSGDGADELFGGYRKHLAELKIREISGFKKSVISGTSKLLSLKKSSRSERLGDFNRRLKKFSEGFKLSPRERYINWCKWINDIDRSRLLKANGPLIVEITQQEINDLNDFLIRDQQFVLPNDMLKKVDMMSMAHALEVRVPFLDHEVVEFANSLPVDFKVTSKMTKKILRETYAGQLPEEIITRSKKGFEIPLEEWLGDEITNIFSSVIFSKKYIEDQNLFDYSFILEIVNDWKNGRIGERIYLIWALIVFQNWYQKNSTSHD